MNNQLKSSIQEGLEFLASNQLKSGGYKGLSSSRMAFYEAIGTQTIFVTALILCSLRNINEAKGICSKAANYLLKHKSQEWSWNYWQRGSTARPYPDDLDDTACVVAGIAGYNSDLITPIAQAYIARSLIASESKPGGPYVTWLMPQAATEWRDIDPAVNANIGFMLSMLGVTSNALERYITDCINNQQLDSPYYVSTTATIYFMARGYRGPGQTRLCQLAIDRLDQAATPLEQALLISAVCYLGGQAAITTEYIQRLLSWQRQGAWPANPLYYEPPSRGEVRYAGSPELTTALCVEAINLYLQPQNDIDGQQEVPVSVKDLHKQLLLKQVDPEVIDIAGVINRAGRWSVKDSVIRQLNRGSRNGWLAYSIYDDFLDGEGKPTQMSVANIALRQSVTCFKSAVTNQDFAKFVEDVFDLVDAANSWELHHARSIDKLPQYGHYAKLAQRSWGHVVAPTAVLLIAGFRLDGREVEQLHNFFRQYLIAKQLCDDAHDWLDDLRNGRVSPVVALLLGSCTSSDDTALQLYFWEHTIDEVNTLIRQHIVRARTMLDNCDFLAKKSELDQWLKNLEEVCLHAEQGRQSARQFIATFTASNLVK